jgi:hypothetical protein
MEDQRNSTLGYFYPVENVVDEKAGARNSTEPTGWSGYLRVAKFFLKLCF